MAEAGSLTILRAIPLLLLAMLTGAAAGPCAQRLFEGSAFTVCPFDAKTQALSLMRPPSRGFAGLAARGVAFGMNAGMFDDAGAPLGLYVENGRRLHPLNRAAGAGNFYMRPNGVFSQDTDGRLRIETTEAFAARRGAPRWATQSGPMLLIAGKLHPQVASDGPSRYVRNGVCLRDGGRAFFAISEEAVSFGKLARLFRDKLRCRDALYLDGAVSSLWVPSEQRLDNRAPLGPIAIVSAAASRNTPRSARSPSAAR